MRAQDKLKYWGVTTALNIISFEESAECFLEQIMQKCE